MPDEHPIEEPAALFKGGVQRENNKMPGVQMNLRIGTGRQHISGLVAKFNQDSLDLSKLEQNDGSVLAPTNAHFNHSRQFIPVLQERN